MSSTPHLTSATSGPSGTIACSSCLLSSNAFCRSGRARPSSVPAATARCSPIWWSASISKSSGVPVPAKAPVPLDSSQRSSRTAGTSSSRLTDRAARPMNSGKASFFSPSNRARKSCRLIWNIRALGGFGAGTASFFPGRFPRARHLWPATPRRGHRDGRRIRARTEAFAGGHAATCGDALGSVATPGLVIQSPESFETKDLTLAIHGFSHAHALPCNCEFPLRASPDRDDKAKRP